MIRFLPLPMALACTPGTVLTESIPQSGYVEVEVETDVEVASVHLGGIAGIYVSQSDGLLRFTAQGHPEPGRHDLLLTDVDGKEHTFRGAVEVIAAETGFERVVTMGASLGQGVQGGVPTVNGQLHAPSRFVAEAVGAYHPIPLMVPDLFPRITGAEVSAAPECRSPDVVDFIASAAVDVIRELDDPEADQIGFYLGREDPDIEVYNVSVGNSSVPTLLNGPDEGDIAQRFLARLVYDPYGDIADPVPVSQLELVEALEPTVIMVPDTYGNDLIGAILNGDVPNPDGLTPPAELRIDMDALIDRLAATGAEVFLANIPDATLLPATDDKVANAREAGWTEQEITEALAAIEATGEGYAAELDASAARYDNVHVVDTLSAVRDIVDTGVPAGDATLQVAAYGGFLSTDGVHFTDSGYAFEANLFLEAMEAAMGTTLPRVDLAAVQAEDPFRPEALIEQGLDPDCLP